jgi:predicted aldo/keto reductase-like oxidoreductase
MKKNPVSILSRRDFMRLSAAVAAGATIMPGFMCTTGMAPAPMKRRFGRINFPVTTLGLGGQASLQWTPDDVDPVAIILKSFELGVNYLDTSNVYGPSQLNFGKAFQKLNLIPGQPGYDKRLRESVFLTTKTMIRWAKGGFERMDNVRNATNGDHGGGAIDDLKRSLSQMFGNDDGTYPDGAYVDMVLIHNLNNYEEIDVLYKGLETPLHTDENFGALVALRDYRDGTNITGLNPNHEKLIKHLGFSGHRSAPVMIEMIQRDEYDLLDGMLVSVNVNDNLYFNMQHNVIPVARERDMGIIGMKVFSDGAMYTKDAKWGNLPEEIVRTVGSDDLPSRPLIEYVLTTPGIHTLIIGIGQIDEDPLKCQLVQNYYASQINEDAVSEQERHEMERLGLKAKEGETNYFQLPYQELTPPRNAYVMADAQSTQLFWDTPYAGNQPISHYEILRNGELMSTLNHTPQISKVPYAVDLQAPGTAEYQIVAVDAGGKKAASDILRV